MNLRVGSLFSGIGGLELGLESLGMEVAWQVEIDPFCREVLAHHWPNVRRFDDVRSVSSEDLEYVDVICGGYPCQPFSLAGKRKGKNDERHLWPEFHRLLRDLRPKYAILENVPGHLSMGFGEVLSDLHQIGYDAEWDIIAAADYRVGAPHLRKRLFVIAVNREMADTKVQFGKWGSAAGGLGGRPEAPTGGLGTVSMAESDGGTDATKRGECKVASRKGSQRGDDGGRGTGNVEREVATRGAGENPVHVANPDSQRGCLREAHRENAKDAGQSSGCERPGAWDSEPHLDMLADGVPAAMVALERGGDGLGDRPLPRVVLSRRIGRRTVKLRALGNAVVPQVARVIGQRLLEIEREGWA